MKMIIQALLDVDVEDTLDREESKQVEDDEYNEEDDPQRRLPHQCHSGVIHQEEQKEEAHRPEAEDPASKSLLRCQRLNFALDPLPIAHRLGDAVEHLGEVAASVALDEDRGHNDVYIVTADAFVEARQRCFHACAEIHVEEHAVQLDGHGRADPLRGYVDALREREARSQRARDQRDRLDELSVYLLDAALGPKAYPERRHLIEHKARNEAH